jgi:hypothetical protein
MGVLPHFHTCILFREKGCSTLTLLNYFRGLPSRLHRTAKLSANSRMEMRTPQLSPAPDILFDTLGLECRLATFVIT